MYYPQEGFGKIFARLQLAALCSMAVALAAAPMTHAQACDPPPTGTMVAWYPFDETAGPTSANLATQNTGVWTSTPQPTPAAGKVGVALNFNGNSYEDAPDSIVTNFGPASAATTCGGGDFSTCQGNFSIDVWVNLNALAQGVETMVDKRDGTPIGYSFYLYRNTAYSNGTYIGLQLGDVTGYTNYASSPRNITANAWHLVAVTVNRTGKINWYLDGAQITAPLTPTQTGSLVNNVPLRIGANGPANGSGNFFNGTLDELEIFNRVLTPGEVKAIFAAGASGKCKP